jgi:hypothetical protein
LPLTTKRRPTIALLSKLRRPLNVIHGNDHFTKFNRARGNSQDIRGRRRRAAWICVFEISANERAPVR